MEEEKQITREENMEANKFIEKKFFNRHFFLEAINESKHPIDFIADLMEEWEQLRIHGVVGRSEQLRAFKEFLQSEYHLPVSNRMIDEFEQKQSS
jgi:hypothetical protein